MFKRTTKIAIAKVLIIVCLIFNCSNLSLVSSAIDFIGGMQGSVPKSLYFQPVIYKNDDNQRLIASVYDENNRWFLVSSSDAINWDITMETSSYSHGMYDYIWSSNPRDSMYYASSDGIVWESDNEAIYDDTNHWDYTYLSFDYITINDLTHSISVDVEGVHQPLKFFWNNIQINSPVSLPSAIKFLPYSVKLFEEGVTVTLAPDSNPLPDGLEIDVESGEIFGIPKESGFFEFVLAADDDGAQSYTVCFIDIADNETIIEYLDEGYEIIEYIGQLDTTMGEDRMLKTDYSEEVFIIEGGTIDEFTDLYYDGVKLILDTDYTAEAGSVKITIKSQTFRQFGEGTHTIAAEFRIGEGEIKRVAQTFTVDVPDAPTYPEVPTNPVTPPWLGGGGVIPTGVPIPASEPEQEVEPIQDLEPISVDETESEDLFNDVNSDDWFFSDVEWVTKNEYMMGVEEGVFAPYAEISDATAVTTLARLAEIDLTKYTDLGHVESENGLWYSEALAWANSAGIIDNGNISTNPPTSRGNLALMLVRYLEHLDITLITTEEYVEFEDAADMTSEEKEAFQILYKLGIFKGTGGSIMDPNGSTTRAELAALLHRVAVFVGSSTQG